MDPTKEIVLGGQVICQADIYHPQNSDIYHPQIRTFPTPQKKHLPGGQLPPPIFFFFFWRTFLGFFDLQLMEDIKDGKEEVLDEDAESQCVIIRFCQILNCLNASVASKRLQNVLSPKCFAFSTSLDHTPQKAKPRKCAEKRRKKIGGGSCPPGKCLVFGGGKCPNLGVVNVRILGVVNVFLANDTQSKVPLLSCAIFSTWRPLTKFHCLKCTNPCVTFGKSLTFSCKKSVF